MRECTSLGTGVRTARAYGQADAPEVFKPYVKTNKQDGHDAEAICEAVGRPTMRFVSIKTVEQADLQAHIARDRS